MTKAFARIGIMPYIWGGPSDGPGDEFGVSSRGGYDARACLAGLQVQLYPDEARSSRRFAGRTNYQMSGRGSRTQADRPLAELQDRPT